MKRVKSAAIGITCSRCIEFLDFCSGVDVSVVLNLVYSYM